MNEQAVKVGAGFSLLVAVWIGTYWAWEPRRPSVSLAEPGGPPTGEPISSTTRPTPAPVPQSGGTGRPERPPTSASGTPPEGPPAEMVERAIPPKMIEHIVASNETLSSIARQYFGDASLAPRIARANPFLDPERLKEGRVIRIPLDPADIQGRVERVPAAAPPAQVQPSAPAAPTPPPSPRTYVVRDGDTLSGIARRMLGKSSLHNLIYEANRNLLKSPDDLRPGQTLVIPDVP